MAEVFLKLVKQINPHILETLKNPKHKQYEGNSPKHIIIKLLKTNDKKKILKAA